MPATTKSTLRILDPPPPPPLMAPENQEPPKFSKTQRIVLLIDLHPLLTLQNHPSSYLSTVAAAALRILRFPPLAASLSTFKLFFSSLSPIRSAAVLPRHLSAPSLSFNLAPQTLDSLSATLTSITNGIDVQDSASGARASYTASSLLQLIHDYSWEADNRLGEFDGFVDGGFVRIPSNLVILLSDIGSVGSLVDYLEMREFDEAFYVTREAFVVRDIHLCWVDVRCDELEIEDADEKKSECRDKLVILKDGIRKMGWGFCSSDLIVIGSALLPFGLIYPKIGVSFEFEDFGCFDKKRHIGELSLEMLDVNGMPIECKGCDLEFVNVKSLPCNIGTDDMPNALGSRDSQSLHVEDAFLSHLGEGNMKLRVKNVHRYAECEKAGGFSEIILVRECFKELGKNKKKSGDDFLSDRILKMLYGEMGGVTCRNQIPTWQMFLSFLHMKGFCALVSLSSSNGDSVMASLKPFTAYSAILYILDAGHISIRDKSGSNEKINSDDMNDSNRYSGSQSDTSTSGNCEQYRDGKRKKSQRQMYLEMTWASFCKSALEGSNFDLFELYTTRYFQNSKKLKFLKCWTKQISCVDLHFLIASPGSKSVEELSTCNALSSAPSPAKDEAMPVKKLETSETFFDSLSNRIQHGLESGMDLQNLAERVVKSSIHWLYHKSDKDNNAEGQESMRHSDDSCSEFVGGKLMELLLRSPKEMKNIHQDSNLCSSSENIVREYELQIFLRLEILQSSISTKMGESRKQKLLKQICSLLEIIQYLVAGGIHGHVSLYDYIERTIRARYNNELEGVVNKIYTEMDLLPFGNDDEAPSLLFNSEDSNQSWRDMHGRNDRAENNSTNQSVSTEGESSQSLANACNNPKGIGEDDYTRILSEALEKREKARRSAPFLSKARDLQRVWAPKLPKAMKCKFGPLPNKSKSKRTDGQTPYTVVCETPMTGNKRACFKGDKKHDEFGNSSYSVSKALFQDN